MPIQNLILDLGGVIINLDYNRTASGFKALGISDFDEIYSKAKQSNLFDNFEKGKLDAPGFRAEIRKSLSLAITDEHIDRAWNAMLIDLPKARLDFIRQLRKTYRVFLLSNTNAIHVEAFRKMAADTVGLNFFEQTFEKLYLSCELGMRKPDAEIFELVVNENNLVKAETLFIDDSIQHIHGALEIGLHAEWLDLEKGETLERKYPLKK